MNSTPVSNLFLLATLVALLAHPAASLAATTCDPPIAKMVSVQGNVEVRRAGQAQSQPARLNDTYCPGDRIQVGEKSRADVALVNQPLLRLDQNTVITLAGLKEERASIIDLARGALHFFSRLPRNLEINTAFVNAGVEGTEGVVEAETNRATITIFEGKVLAANALGRLALADGQSAVAERGRAPVLRIVVRPRDAVQWALYYPPVTYFRQEDFQGGQAWQGMARNSVDAYMKGDYERAETFFRRRLDTLRPLSPGQDEALAVPLPEVCARPLRPKFRVGLAQTIGEDQLQAPVAVAILNGAVAVFGLRAEPNWSSASPSRRSSGS